MERQFYVYIRTNKYNNVLYTGMTRDLMRCVFEHKHHYVRFYNEI